VKCRALRIPIFPLVETRTAWDYFTSFGMKMREI